MRNETESQKMNVELRSIESLLEYLPARQKSVDCIGMCGSARSYLVSKIFEKLSKSIVLVVANKKDAQIVINELEFFLNKSGIEILYFPPYNISPFKNLSYHNKTAAQRISTLYKIISSENRNIVITTVDGLLQKLIPKKELLDYAELLIVEEDIDEKMLVEKLVAGGYSRTMIVEEPGDFAVRGGIIDIYSPMYDNPVRIELFGDMVEGLRFFDPVSQRKIRSIDEAIILPVREAIVRQENVSEIVRRIRLEASALDIEPKNIREIIENIRSESVLPQIEGLISLIYEKSDLFFDYVTNKTLFIIQEPGELEKGANSLWEQVYKNFDLAKKESRLCVEPTSLYLKWQDVNNIFNLKKRIAFRSVQKAISLSDESDPVSEWFFELKDNLDVKDELKLFHSKDNLLRPLANWISDKTQKGNSVVIVCRSKLQGDRVRFLIEPYNIKPVLIERISEAKKSQVYICLGQISSGFVWESETLSIISEDEIFGVKHVTRKKSKPAIEGEMLDFSELKKGDLIVHIDHGIGKYDGLVKLSINNITGDFLLIYYKDDDKLYVPVDRITMVQKYMGVDDIQPVLDKMGGKSWNIVKEKVKKSVEKIAGKLLELYAARKVEKGYAFEKSSSFFKDFEAGFPYEETEDQLSAIEDVIEDMEKPLPMDRLVCGDVGYGKTEVALRASFKAVESNKQVAILVPTTILAEQHLKTFSERFERYPINIACLSRFRSLQEQRVIIKDLADGKTDIVIGTHRLVQKDVVFKELGLVILDEEHRFGVKHKEKLKQLRKTVDVMTLTATPIPRTLHLSLTGIRDISVISTPPEERQSITTYLCEFEDGIIAEAIQKELARGGQIFFVHNNIYNIQAMAHHLKGLVPGVRLDVAHGRMKERELERVMLKFINKDIDMLVCTTIVESGLDIPSANTILINRADRFGLAQMHQLRGRVGRAEEQAFAYLFIPRESALSKQGQKRLKVLMEHSDLGSGFQIAMNDLKIRGGGTILGASQSGHIAAVGYDMFLELMKNTISAIKGKPVLAKLDPEINISMSAFIPESYIPDIDQRVLAYRNLAKMTELKDIAEYKEELVDRFGALPAEAVNLLLKIMLRVLCIQAGVKKLDLLGQNLLLQFSGSHIKNPEGIIRLVDSDKSKYKLTPDNMLKVRLLENTSTGLLAETKNILQEIMQRVNN